jgi:hypothetical protein
MCQNLGAGSCEPVRFGGYQIGATLNVGEFFAKMVNAQAQALTAATGLKWTHDGTGGGHDARDNGILTVGELRRWLVGLDDLTQVVGGLELTTNGGKQ